MDMLKDERFDFTILENDIVRDTKKYNKNELLAYIAISYHADKAGTCFPSYEGIARIMRTSRTTAINAIQGLVEKGVIKLENRKADEKKKEMTSNLYTLVSNKYWEQVERENKVYLAKKGVDYKKRYAKGKATKIANRNAKLREEQESKKNTSVPTGIETDVYSNGSSQNQNNSFDTPIIPQENKECTQESFDKNGQNMTNREWMSERLRTRVELMEKAGIKYIPYKTDAECIESLDIGLLKQAIDITVEQSTSKSWRYLLSTFDTLSLERHRKNQEHREEVKKTFTPNFQHTYKPQYRGGIGAVTAVYGGKRFEDWDAEEFNREVARIHSLR